MIFPRADLTSKPRGADRLFVLALRVLVGVYAFWVRLRSPRTRVHFEYTLETR